MYICLLLLLVACAVAQECPVQYLRLSAQHSYCLPPNAQCTIVSQGVSQEEQDLILRLHNQLRNDIATGIANRTDLPQASNMIQMVWDDEIAAIAQKWVDQCQFEHDCDMCRSTANYQDGQNLDSYGPVTCLSSQCSGDQDQGIRTSDWEAAVYQWYDEVQYIDTELTDNYVFAKSYGHYSQLAWAKTWRVGCGYSVYMQGNGASRLYGCDYAPSGNSDNEPIYQTGTPCSQCPENTQCSTEYPSLCQPNDPNIAPVYPDPQQTIYNCDFTANNPDCAFSLSDGVDAWQVESRLWGAVLSAQLEGGQSSTVNFSQIINPTEGFCLVFEVRKGPNVAGEEDNNVATADIQQPPSMPSWESALRTGGGSLPCNSPTSRHRRRLL